MPTLGEKDSSGMPEQPKKPVSQRSVAGRRKKLGELLVQAGLIDDETLKEALVLQKGQNRKIGQVLINMGAVDDKALAKGLAEQLRIPFVRLKGVQISGTVIQKVPLDIAQRYSLIPLRIAKGKLVVAVANPLELSATDDIRFITQMPIYLVVSPMGDILKALERYYPKPDIETDLGFGIDVPEDIVIVQKKEGEEKRDEDLMNLADLPPVVRFTNALIAEGIRIKASDIHIEPHKTKLKVRCRIDGVMRETMVTDKHVHAALVSRIKVVSNLDISIRRKPQDGKTQVNYSGVLYDLRVSTIPTSYGEKVTIRILNPATAKMSPVDLGFSKRDLEKVTDAISRPQGMILVTGPTGSGKSSTLYACLNKLNTPLVNIVTVEDPVEFDVDGINQVQINPKAGITFARGLRSILRQDPDIVMVGEIRDAETAAVAFQAAQTGHLVLSTLHTNDAPSTITRLLDLDVDHFQISAALIAVIGQRLVRRIHEKCKIPDTPPPQILRRIQSVMGKDGISSFWKGAGCKECMNSGYSGRMGVYELLIVTPAVKECIAPNVSAQDIGRTAAGQGFQTLSQDGIRKAMEGLTTLEEVFRVSPPDILGEARAAKGDAGQGAGVQSADHRLISAGISAGTETAERQPAAGPPRVLIVDDSEEVILLLRRILENRHYTVLSAGNGKTAVQLAEAERPDLIITDYDMPEMDGMTLIRMLKSTETTRHIPIIMLTAKDEVDDEVQVIEAGADDYLTKPVSAKRLLARVGRFFVKRKKILVVDDSEDMRLLLRRMLESAEYIIVTADNGKEAISMVQAEKPDVVITDYMMPEMDGVALIRALKSREGTRKIPVIMLTAKDEVDAEVRVFEAGADDYLTKPVNAKRLVSRVKRLFRENR